MLTITWEQANKLADEVADSFMEMLLRFNRENPDVDGKELFEAIDDTARAYYRSLFLTSLENEYEIIQPELGGIGAEAQGETEKGASDTINLGRAIAGGLIGGTIGAVAGAAIGGAASGRAANADDDTTSGAIAGGIIGGAVGAAIGAGIGQGRATEDPTSEMSTNTREEDAADDEDSSSRSYTASY